MVHQRSPRQRGVPGRPTIVLALAALLLLGPALLPGQEVLRYDFAAKGQYQPIELAADEVLTWSAAGTRVFVLHGNVRAVQGDTVMRMAHAVAWVDEAGQQRTGVYMVDLYGEVNVELQRGGETRTAIQGMIQLATRGNVKIAAYTKNAQATPPLTADPLYRRRRPTEARRRHRRHSLPPARLRKWSATSEVCRRPVRSSKPWRTACRWPIRRRSRRCNSSRLRPHRQAYHRRSRRSQPCRSRACRSRSLRRRSRRCRACRQAIRRRGARPSCRRR